MFSVQGKVFDAAARKCIGFTPRTARARFACQGNPDQTTTHGKRVAEAKAIEEKCWDYPKHLAGRAYGVVVHGDVAGVDVHRRNLTDWLDWMGLIDAEAPPSSTATSAIAGPTTTATTRSTQNRPCRKKRATSRARWFRRSRNCGLGG